MEASGQYLIERVSEMLQKRGVGSLQLPRESDKGQADLIVQNGSRDLRSSAKNSAHTVNPIFVPLSAMPFFDSNTVKRRDNIPTIDCCWPSSSSE